MLRLEGNEDDVYHCSPLLTCESLAYRAGCGESCEFAIFPPLATWRSHAGQHPAVQGRRHQPGLPNRLW